MLAELRPDADARLYHIKLRYAGSDPRIALREKSKLSPTEREQLVARLARLDAAGESGPWTARVLQTIANLPGEVSSELSVRLGIGKDRSNSMSGS